MFFVISRNDQCNNFKFLIDMYFVKSTSLNMFDNFYIVFPLVFLSIVRSNESF